MSRQPGHVALLSQVASTVIDGRSAAAISQRELSRRSGVPQSRISSIERGQAGWIRSDDLDRLLVALETEYWLGTRQLTLIRPRQTDLVHARCSAHVQRRLGRDGWLVAREVEIRSGRSSGWIDLLAFHPRSGILLV